ncbi:beta-eliminating lyase-related protein [Streptomyces sp. H10-C2]|uniref:threonine aldolase family protein n=1 Tax=unclassified Streptomyces TaxID=2593676 RepID=UPI0024BAC8AA|nr:MULTISPECIES: beta-eliminating lyase-related protein [unclassified Streptomyces]MDJ0345341.1 beta-eliminating lyase-related protein [Streptomyces sp. PH10-H1]MDJ0374220.1 beta-eliminating lyase-related protein [Streptomyces sp. H10-C2]
MANASEDEKTARLAAVRACDRVLSTGKRPLMRERLDRLVAEGAAAHDLDSPTDMYGDGIVATLEQRVAGLLGTEAAAFFPTGTMAQQVALRCWAGRTGNPTVAMHPLAHPEVHERDAVSVVSGLRTVHPTTAPRLPSADEIRDLDEPFGTLMLELPLRDAGFQLPTWEELTATVAAARERDAVVHFDGARLWECPPHFERSLSEIADLADSVYVSFYKSLGGISGAVLAGPTDLVAEAKAWRHRYGGLPFEQFPTALAALAGLDDVLPRLPSYVAHAKVVAEGLRAGFAGAVPFFRINPEVPFTHQFQVWLPFPAASLDAAGLRQATETKSVVFGKWFDTEVPGMSVTEVTVAESALEWTADDVADGVAAFVERLPAS